MKLFCKILFIFTICPSSIFPQIFLDSNEIEQILNYIKEEEYERVVDKYGHLFRNDLNKNEKIIIIKKNRENIIKKINEIKNRKSETVYSAESSEGKLFIPLPIENKSAFGFNYPFMSFKYCFSNTLGCEIKGYFSSSVVSYGSRLTLYTKKGIYTGIEFDQIDLIKEQSTFVGAVIFYFVGSEYLINEKTSVSFDTGPALLKSGGFRDYSFSLSNINWFFSIGIWFYF